MTPEEIEVGAYYKNTYLGHRGQVFLGVGLRKLWTSDEFLTKDLVIVSSPDPRDVGLIAQKGENATKEFWEGFDKL